MKDLDSALEIWADYIRGGRVLRTGKDRVLAKFMDGGDWGSGVYGSRMLAGSVDIAEHIESLVQRLHSLKPEQAQVLRTEYGLTRFWDTRSQAYRAAKMDVSLRTYEYRLAKAREKLGLWFKN